MSTRVKMKGVLFLTLVGILLIGHNMSSGNIQTHHFSSMSLTDIKEAGFSPIPRVVMSARSVFDCADKCIQHQLCEGTQYFTKKTYCILLRAGKESPIKIASNSIVLRIRTVTKHKKAESSRRTSNSDQTVTKKKAQLSTNTSNFNQKVTLKNAESNTKTSNSVHNVAQKKTESIKKTSYSDINVTPKNEQSSTKISKSDQNVTPVERQPSLNTSHLKFTSKMAEASKETTNSVPVLRTRTTEASTKKPNLQPIVTAKVCNIGYSMDYSRDHCRILKECTTYTNKFVKYEKMVLWGHNAEIYHRKTSEQCMKECLRAKKYVCKSVNHDFRSKTCYPKSLSWYEVNDAATRRGLLYHFYERQCDW